MTAQVFLRVAFHSRSPVVTEVALTIAPTDAPVFEPEVGVEIAIRLPMRIAVRTTPGTVPGTVPQVILRALFSAGSEWTIALTRCGTLSYRDGPLREARILV